MIIGAGPIIITTTTFNLRPGAGSLTTRPAGHRGDAPRREIQRPRTIRLHHHTTVQRFNPGVDKLWICLSTQSFFQATTNWWDRDDGRGLSKTAPAERLFIFSTSDLILSIPVSKDWPLKNISNVPTLWKLWIILNQISCTWAVMMLIPVGNGFQLWIWVPQFLSTPFQVACACTVHLVNT